MSRLNIIFKDSSIILSYNHPPRQKSMKKTKEEIIKLQQKLSELCQVCLTKDPTEKKAHKAKQQQDRKKVLEIHTCLTCKAIVHKFCYDPSLHQPTKTWKCDFCKASKTKSNKQQCFICKCEGKMLKYVDQNKFAHIHCALSSDMVILENFKTLKFKLNPDYRPKDSSKQNSKEKIKDKQIAANQKCTFCKKDSSEAVCKCYHEDCNFSAHIHCLLERKILEEVDDDIIYNLLNETMGSFRVKNADFLRKQCQILRGMNMLEKSKRSVPLITCSGHSSELKWCSICFNVDPLAGMDECCRCYRWTHTECAQMKNKSENAYFECDACIKNFIYLQRALFPEQISRFVKIETSPNKWTREDIKYLDSFAFKTSTQICNQILTKNKQQFEHYHLYQFLEKEYLKSFENKEKDKKLESLEKILQRITTKDLKELNNKKIIEILYYLKYKELRNKNQLNTPAEINDLKEAYQIHNAKNNLKSSVKVVAEQQKCKKILDKLLDLYIKGLKQSQMKDVSIKLVQFSDKIRRQIVNIKQNFSIGPDQSKKSKKNENAQSILQLLKKRPYQIALDMRQLFKMLSTNKDKLKVRFDMDLKQQGMDQQQNISENNVRNAAKINKSKQVNYNCFLMTLIKCVISKDDVNENQVIEVEDLQDLVESYRRIVYVSRMMTKKPQRKLTLSQEELYKIMNKTYDQNKTKLSQESKIRISKFFKSLIKENNIKQSSQLRTELIQKYDQLISQDRLNYKQAMIMRQNIAEQGLFVDKHSKLMNLQKRAIYYRVLKIKYMKIVNLELNEEKSGFSLRPNQKNRKDIIDNVKRLLDANGKSIKLTETEKSQLEYFLVKEEVFTNILREQAVLGSKLNKYSPDNLGQSSKIEVESQQGSKQSQKQNGSIENKKDQLTTLQRIRRIFGYWIQNSIESPYHIIKILTPIADKKIKFPFEYQTMFNDLIESIGTRYDLLFKCQDQSMLMGNNNYRVTSDEFVKVWKLIQYAELQNAYEKLKNLHDEYQQWIQELQHRYNPISAVLQDKFLNSQLLELIDRKITEAETFEIDLKSEVKKLKTVKLWVVLSQKFQKDFQKKPTINAIQQFKSLMIKVHYPHNQIFQKVLQLENYGRQLNERIDKYLKKQKQEDLQVYEEICLINSKMSLIEAEQLRNELENSRLDVSAQLQELQDEIENFNKIPTKIEPFLKKQGNLEELIKIKNKIMETPLKFENMEVYCNLIRRIGFLKCQNLEGNITKKEFFRLLSTSDLGAVTLTEKMPMLLKAYREIEKAEKQVLQPKPRYENMLPINGKNIKSDLVKDPISLAQIEKIYQRVDSLRDKFQSYRNSREPFEKYLALEYELSHYPINYKDIASEIHKMKRELDDLVDKSMMLKKNFNSKQAHEVVRRYSKLGMKHDEVQSVRKIYESYSVCMSLSQSQDDYVEFSQKCKDYPELESIISLNEIRNQLFSQYSEEVLNEKADANSESKTNLSLMHALIQQGSLLCRHVIYPSKSNIAIRTKIIETLLKLNNKIDDMMKTSSGTNKMKKEKKKNPNSDDDEYPSDEIGDDSGPYSDSDEGNDEEMDDFQDEEDNDDDEMDYDEYDDDEEESIPQPPKKRSQPLVMEISDEDNEPSPEPRKMQHLPGENEAVEIVSEMNEQDIKNSDK